MPDETDDEDDDPTADCDGPAGLAYRLIKCSDGSHAGDIATATSFGLHVNGGNKKAGTTTVSLGLTEQEPCGGTIDCLTQVIDDNNPCTTDACNATDGVTHVPVAAGTSCSDNNACNGLETCSATGVCEPGTPPTVDDGNICTGDACDPILGVTHTPTPGVSCSDGNVCNGNEICGATGTCLTGTPLITDDGNACTADVCDPINGVSHTPTPGVVCGGSFCAPSVCDPSAACVAGAPPNLDDGDACTIDSCDSVNNVIVHKPCSKIDPTIATSVAAATSWLYTGTDPVQVGVAPGTISDVRGAVVQGNVTLPDGSAAPDVSVVIVDHPELGSTTTDGYGHYIMAVNGGGSLTINVTKPGYVTIQRHVDAQPNAYQSATDIALTAVDPNDTFVDLQTATDITIARGSVVSDTRGTRQPTLLVPPDITATMVMPDGSTAPLDTLTIHATELTVGPNGLAHMPGELPPTSGYTHAVNIISEEAVAAGAEHVRFSSPIPYYVEDYYDFPVGLRVPVGTYDPQSGTWQAEQDGLVIAITSFTGGVAQIDTTGDGAPESDAVLGALGITLPERTELSALYPAGTKLWRAALGHFSTIDLNMPNDALPPKTPPPPLHAPATPKQVCTVAANSTIECQTQGLREQVDVAGTPFTLTYDSLRTKGYDSRSVPIKLTGDSPSPSMFRVEAKLEIAGVTVEQDLDCPCVGTTCSCPANQSTELAWDGRDQFGRFLFGAQIGKVTVTNVYFSYYQVDIAARSGFAITGSGPIVPPIPNFVPFKTDTSLIVKLGSNVAEAQALGGWMLNAVHVYDPNAEELYLGNGEKRGTSPAPGVITTLTDAQADSIGVMPDGRVVLDQGSDIALLNQDTSLEYLTAHNLPANGCPPLNTTVPPCVAASTCSVPANCWAADGAPAASVVPNPGGGPASVQIAVTSNGAIYLGRSFEITEITPDRRWRIIANEDRFTGVDSGDGGPASQATFAQLTGLTADANGFVYVSSSLGHRIRRVDSGGTVQTIAGTGAPGVTGDEGPAVIAEVSSPTLLATSGNGDLTFFDADARIIRRIDAGGVIHTDAGGGTSFADGPALAFNIINVDDLIASKDGTIYLTGPLAPANANTVVQLKAGQITRVTGGIPCSSNGICGSSGPFNSAGLDFFAFPRLALDQQGDLYLSAEGIHRIGSLFPIRGVNTTSIPSEDASELYIFDANGRHLQTADATTGTALYTMAYDTGGRLISIVDRDGLQTTITRAPDGTATGIVGPFGQTTTLTVGSDGLISRIQDASGAHWDMTYANELMQTFTNRNGHVSSMEYDPKGRIKHDADSVGGFMDLVRTDDDTDGGWTVARTTALGRTTQYHTTATSLTFGVVTLAAVEHDEVTGPDGLQTLTHLTPSQTFTTFPNGMEHDTVTMPDSRFGMLAPLTKATDTTPAGLTRFVEQSRSTSLADPLDVLSVISRTDTSTINGKSWTSTYQTATNVETITSPAGRVTTTTFDDLGHVIEVDVPNILPVTFTYDAEGRLKSTVQGTRTTTTTYGPDGRIASVTDALGRTSSITMRDAVGRVTAATRPDLAATTFGYDADGETTAVTPPGKPEHQFTYDARNLPLAYDPPVLASGPTDTAYSFNLDKQPDQVTQPGPRIVQYGYDGAGRPSTTTFPTGSISRTYDTQGRIDTITGPTGVTTTYGYDGDLLNDMSWSGAVTGSVSRTFDADFRIATETVNGAFPVSFGYDDDSLLVNAGDLSIARDPLNGRVTGTTAGVVSEARGYDLFGGIMSSTFTVNGTSSLAFAYTPDDLGRIATKTETIGSGPAHNYSYDYDEVGRLHHVTLDGTVVEHYEYDLNGNRTLSENSAGSFSATYDEQDRMQTYGSLAFTYTLNGELATKTDTTDNSTTTYTYDALGNLREVVLPDGQDLTYVIDGSGKRIAKVLDGVTERRWLWGGRLQPVAELDASGNLSKRFIYAGGNAPSLIETSSGTYRVVKDQLGSVRQVVDTGSGAIVQALAYDGWGRVISDSNPGFQPFGFAGGLNDADTGLVTFGLRDYDPSQGRWTTKDPIGLSGGTSVYAYVNGDPVNQRDPFGLTNGSDGAGPTGDPYYEGNSRLVLDAESAAFISDVLQVLAQDVLFFATLDIGGEGRALSCAERADPAIETSSIPARDLVKEMNRLDAAAGAVPNTSRKLAKFFTANEGSAELKMVDGVGRDELLVYRQVAVEAIETETAKGANAEFQQARIELIDRALDRIH